MVMALVISAMVGFNSPTGARTIATFGNSATRDILKMWQPQPLNIASGDVLLPSSKENMQRFVRARILLEDPSLGCVASFDDSLCVILCRFSGAEHQLLLPLWQPTCDDAADSVFNDLKEWHAGCFGANAGPRLSGAHLERDQEAWAKGRPE